MKPRNVMIAIMILGFAVPISVFAAQATKAEKEVRAILEEMRQANLKGGSVAIAFFGKYLADDYVRILPNGALEGKATMMDAWRSGDLKVEKVDWSDIQVHVYGNSAVTTGIADAKFTFKGTTFTGKHRWTRVFVKSGKLWKNVLNQQTNITEPAKR